MAGRGGAFPGDEDDDALPWLEPADLDDPSEDRAPFPYRGLVLASLAIVAAVATLWFIAERFGAETESITATGDVPLIQAPEGPYKVRPADPGGLEVDADSVTYAAAEGAAPGGTIDIASVPEEPVPVATAPVVQPQPPAPTEDQPGKRPPTPVAKVPVPAAPKGMVPEPALPKPAPAATGAVTVQLGAFGSAASAEQVWTRLAGRVSALTALGRSVQPVEAGGKTLYRLRASGISSAAEAAAICSQVTSAGEQCAVVR